MSNKNKILDRINSPKDLKKLNKKEINSLCNEIRELIIQVVSKNGGHFSSPLGVVDLTVSLHKVFDAPPTDGLWDDGRTDEGQLGMSYKDIELAMNDPKSPNREKYEKIRLTNLQKGKRQIKTTNILKLPINNGGTFSLKITF